VTTLLFAYAHLHAIWFIDASLSQFVVYQFFYTLVLGAACGWMIQAKAAWLGAWVLHVGFNLGFWLGAVLVF
jgi:hypothetical protein